MPDGTGYTNPIVIYVHEGTVKAVLNSSSEVTPEYVVFHLDTDPDEDIDMFDVPMPGGTRVVSYVFSGSVLPMSEDVEDAAWAFIEGRVTE